MNCCGLLTDQREPVPLKSVEVELEVRDHVATVISTLIYENKEDKPLEAVFVFPMPGDAAVCHFSATIGQKQIVAEVKEKQKAREEYDDALSSGQQAFLLEESDQSPDIFSLSVGSLRPEESASIRLEYVTELAVQADDGLRFCLPAVLNPRYEPQVSTESGGPEGARVQVTSVPTSLVPYTLSFSARVSSPRPVSKVESNCSLDPVQYLNTEQTQATVKLAAGHKFDRDVELLIYYKDAHQPTAVVEAGQTSAKPGTLMGDPALMLSLYPEFPKDVMSSVASCGEFVFLLDRSGSMDCATNNKNDQGSRISSARDTLLLLVKSLPMGCYFNIYSFGSSYEHVFPKSVEYSQTTIEEALKKVNEMNANLGGTEILMPLKHIYQQPCIPNQPRQLFVFTDGEVGNTKDVLTLVKKNSGSHRCFSFGIGEGASTALINGLAKEGGGHAQFITGADRMQPKATQSLRFALQPAVVDVSVKWDLPKKVSVNVLSPPITALFQGQRSLVYAQLTGESSDTAEGCVTVKYSLAGRPSENKLHFGLKPTEDTGLTVHRLAARTLIRSLEMEDRESRGAPDGGVKEKVVEVSVQSGVSSAFTAFIAVNKEDGEAIQGPLVRRNVPTPMMLMSCPMSMPMMMSAGCATRKMPACKKDGRSSRVKNRTFMKLSKMSTQHQAFKAHSMDMDSSERACSFSACEKPGRSSRVKNDAFMKLSKMSPQTEAWEAHSMDMDRSVRFCSFSAMDSEESEEDYPWEKADLSSRVKNRALKKLSKMSPQTESLKAHSMDMDSSERACSFSGPSLPEELTGNPLLQLVSLQQACGCWKLGPALATVLGKTNKEVAKAKPAAVNQDVWATILALVWLHGSKKDAKDEWELLAMKAVSWLRAQKAPSVTRCVKAANALLGCKVQKDTLGL